MSKSKYEVFNEYISPPGDTLKDHLLAFEMTEADLAKKTGLSKKTINEIINAKAPITPNTAIKFGYIFDVPAYLWLKLETDYQEKLARKKEYENIMEDVKYLENLPYNEIAKRNWDFLEPTRDLGERVVSLRKFLGVASLKYEPNILSKINFRKSNNPNFSVKSLYCYIKYGERKFYEEMYPDYDENKLKSSIKDLRNLVCNSFLSELDNIKSCLKKCGVCLVYEPHLKHTYLNGLSYKVCKSNYLIMISDRGKRDDILWFTLFHEIAHILKHSKKEIYIDLENDDKNEVEIEADKYAKNILIKNSLYKKFISKEITEDRIKDFSKENNISPGILVGRLQNDKIIKYSEFNNFIIRL